MASFLRKRFAVKMAGHSGQLLAETTSGRKKHFLFRRKIKRFQGLQTA